MRYSNITLRLLSVLAVALVLAACQTQVTLEPAPEAIAFAANPSGECAPYTAYWKADNWGEDDWGGAIEASNPPGRDAISLGLGGYPPTFTYTNNSDMDLVRIVVKGGQETDATDNPDDSGSITWDAPPAISHVTFCFDDGDEDTTTTTEADTTSTEAGDTTSTEAGDTTTTEAGDTTTTIKEETTLTEGGVTTTVGEATTTTIEDVTITTDPGATTTTSGGGPTITEGGATTTVEVGGGDLTTTPRAVEVARGRWIPIRSPAPPATKSRAPPTSPFLTPVVGMHRSVVSPACWWQLV